MNSKQFAGNEPNYPRHRGDLRGHLYALADASLAIIEYNYVLQHQNDTRDFTRKDEIKAAGFKWKPKPLNRWEKTGDKAADPLAVLAQVIDAPWFPRTPLASNLVAEVQNIKGDVLARKELVGTERQTRTILRSISPATDKLTRARSSKDIDDLPF